MTDTLELIEREVQVLRVARAAATLGIRTLVEARALVNSDPEGAVSIYERARRYSMVARGDASLLSDLEYELLAREMQAQLRIDKQEED